MHGFLVHTIAVLSIIYFNSIESVCGKVAYALIYQLEEFGLLEMLECSAMKGLQGSNLAKIQFVNRVKWIKSAANYFLKSTISCLIRS